MSKELVAQKRELIWPPHNLSDLMAYFLEKEKTDPAFKGMADCADNFVQAIITLINIKDDEIIIKGNKSVELPLTPAGSNHIGNGSEALINAAYAITGSQFAYSHESPKTKRHHLLYEGAYSFTRDGHTRHLPVAFKETYTTGPDGERISGEWLVRTNYPQREVIECTTLQGEEISPDQRLDWSRKLLDSIEQVKVIEVPVPEERFPKAA